MKEIIYFQFLTKYIWIHNRKKKKKTLQAMKLDQQKNVSRVDDYSKPDYSRVDENCCLKTFLKIRVDEKIC